MAMRKRPPLQKREGKRWRVYHFVVEVAVQAPKSMDEIEASEIAYDFATGPLSYSMARMGECFCRITKTYEAPAGSIMRKWIKSQNGKPQKAVPPK